MASQLEQYFASFLTALGADDEESPLFGKVHLGRAHVERNQDAPRIVVWRTQGNIAPPDKVGAELVQIEPGVRARSIALRRAGVSVYCHGRTDEQTEELLHNSIAAWRGVCHNDIRFGAERWNEDPANAKRGAEVIFDVELWFRVYDVQWPLTVVEGYIDEDVWGDESEAIDCRPPEEESESGSASSGS